MNAENKSIRVNALHRMRWSFAFVIIAFSTMYYINENVMNSVPSIGRFIIIPLACLCLPFMFHCFELITGTEFSKASDAWKHLKGWQRGILGTVIVIISGLIIFSVAFSIAMQQF